MKICLINNLYPPYARGGAEQVVSSMAREYVKNKDRVVIISTRPYFSSAKERMEGDDGISKYYLPGLYYNLSKIPLILRLGWHIIDIFDVVTYFRVRRILKTEKPDLVVTHNLKGIGFLIPALIKALKIKHFHYLHDIQLIYPSGIILYGQEKRLDSFLAKAYRKICIRLFNSPDMVISPSVWLEHLHVERGFFKKSKFSGMELAKSKPKPRKKRKNSADYNKKGKKKFRFLYVGQIEKHKGVEILLKAFLKLKAGAELVFVGDGGYRKELEKKIKSGQNIIVAGRKAPDEVAEIMRQSDCLIVPSLCYENSPSVISEAAALGLPVIASRIGGIPELVEKFGGQLFTPGDTAGLKEKMDVIRRKMV